MTLIANPNGLLIASTLFALSGIAILAQSMLASSTTPTSDADAQRRRAHARIANWVGLPLLGGAAFLHGVGQFATGPIGPGLTCLLLALAFSLLVYAMVEDQIADDMTPRADVAVESARRLAIAPPKLKAVETIEPMADVADVSRHALPI